MHFRGSGQSVGSATVPDYAQNRHGYLKNDGYIGDSSNRGNNNAAAQRPYEGTVSVR